MSSNFLDAAKLGKNSLTRYLLGIGLELFFFYILGGTLLSIAAYFLFLLHIENSQISNFFASGFAFISSFVGVVFVVRGIHQRRFRTLISRDGSIRLKSLISAAGLWFLIQAVLLAIDFSLDSKNYTFTFDPKDWLILLPLVLLMTPIQSSAEEFLFRGYLLQGLGLLTRQKWLLISLTSFLFMLPHLGNPEMGRGSFWSALNYFAWGVFFATITLKSNRLEFSLGVHAANNIFAFLVVNTRDSVMPTPAIFTMENPGDPKWSLIGLMVEAGIFYYCFFGRRTRKEEC